MTGNPETTGGKQDGKFRKGRSGNPAGRPPLATAADAATAMSAIIAAVQSGELTPDDRTPDAMERLRALKALPKVARLIAEGAHQ